MQTNPKKIIRFDKTLNSKQNKKNGRLLELRFQNLKNEKKTYFNFIFVFKLTSLALRQGHLSEI